METPTNTLVVENGKCVQPDGILEGETLHIEEGLIVRIGKGRAVNGIKKIDAAGRLILPGIIDLHSDALEKELEPRPNTFFPPEMVLLEMDKKLAACGITTMYHSLSFAEGEIGIRSNKMAEDLVRKINRLLPKFRVRTKVHARYEMTDEAAVPILERLMDEEKIHLLSFMDHTPGQGQFRDVLAFQRYYRAVYQKTDLELRDIIERKFASQNHCKQRLNHLIRLCTQYNIPMASHDDDSEEKVEWLSQKGISIVEFPVNLKAALAAGRNNMHVTLGAPNALRGSSQSKNLSAREALALGACQGLCSDYAPITLLHAVFQLVEVGLLGLPEAVNLISINPASAVGIDRTTGSLQEGKNADFLIVDKENGHAQVLKTFVAGEEVFSTCLK